MTKEVRSINLDESIWEKIDNARGLTAVSTYLNQKLEKVQFD